MIRSISLGLIFATLFFITPVANAGIAWTDAIQKGSVVHFFYAPASTIQRYDLLTETVESSITYSCPATAFTVTAEGYYIACSEKIYFLSFDGLTQTLIASVTQPIYQILVNQTHIYAIKSNEVWAVNKSTSALQYKSYSYSIQNAIYSEANRKIYARNSGVSPADIMMITINLDGTLGNQTDSPYHGAYPSATSTWMSPDESYVVDNSGTMYGPSLLWLGSLGTTVDRMIFTPDGKMIVNKGNVVNLYAASTNLEKTYTLTKQPNSIFLHNDTVYAFTPSLTDIPNLEKVLLAGFSNRPVVGVVDPENMLYVPDETWTDNDGIIYLLHKTSKNIFRWSIPEKKYLASIPLFNEVPYGISYASGNDYVYVLYANGEIQKINPDTLEQSFLYRLAATPCGISATPLYVYACDNSGAWESHYVISQAGTRLAYKEWNYPSKQYIWNQFNNRFYFFRDGTSPNDLMWEEVLPGGTIGAAGDSPYHGSPISVQYPIRVSSNGAVVLLGSGQLFNATNLNIFHTLPEQVSAAIWVNGDLWSAQKLSSGIKIDHWSSLYSRLLTQTLYGNIIELINFNDNVVVISKRNGKPTFTVLASTTDIDLDGESDFIDTTPEGADVDGDMVADYLDNCPGIANVDQIDTDSDSQGNTCDTDDDNDSVLDINDLFPLDPNESLDSDGDGIGDNSDPTPNGNPDLDSDGIDNLTDNCLSISNADQIDSDQNGFGDACEVNTSGVVKNALLGSSIAVADMNADGYDDLLIGSPLADVIAGPVILKDAGKIQIISGANGAVLNTFNGTYAKQQFGAAIAVVADQNADTVPDLIVGNPLTLTGNVSLYSGATGVFLNSIADGAVKGDKFGTSVAVDQSGNLVVGAPLFDIVAVTTLKDAGRVTVFSGISNTVLYTRDGTQAGERFGSAVAVNTVDNRMLIGSPGFDVLLPVKITDAGQVQLFDSTDLTGLSAALFSKTGAVKGDRFGSALTSINQDLDGDTFVDWAVGIPGADVLDMMTNQLMKDAGKVQIFSGLNTTAVTNIDGATQGDNFGAALGSGADVNNDGDNDLAIGAPKFDTSLLKDAGRVEVLSGAELF